MPEVKSRYSPAGVVPDLHALPAHQRQGGARVVLHHIRVVELGGVGADDGRLVHGWEMMSEWLESGGQLHACNSANTGSAVHDFGADTFVGEDLQQQAVRHGGRR